MSEKAVSERSRLQNILHWILGMIICDLGICLCTKANFGLSMISAPPYILHVWLRDTFSWFTQGTAEYVWQAVVFVAVCLVIRKFKFSYLLSFLAAVVTGIIIDGWFLVLGGNGAVEILWVRILLLAVGTCLTALGVALMFRTDLPIQVPEMAVARLAEKWGKTTEKTKFIYDVFMLCVTLAFTFIFTGKLTGVGIGTLVLTFGNAPLIGFFGKLIDKYHL